MRYLVRKTFRDLRSFASQFLAAFLMAALSVLIFTGLEGAWRGMGDEINAFAGETRLPDAWVATLPTVEDNTAVLNRLEGVTGVERTVSVRTTIVSANSPVADPAPAADPVVEVVLLPEQFGVPLLRAGVLPTDDEPGVLVDERFAQARGIHLGDRLVLVSQGREVDVEVTGTVLSADRISYTGGDGFVAPQPDSYGYAYTTAAALDEQFGLRGARTGYAVAGDPAVVLDEAPRLIGEQLLAVNDRSSLPGYAAAVDRTGQIRALSYLFSGLFVLIAVLAASTSMRRLVDMQSREIATMKALGIADRAILIHYTSYGVITAGLGALIGAAAAPLLSTFVLGTQQHAFALPKWAPAYSSAPLLLVALLLLACVVATAAATHRARSVPPAAAMRSGPGVGRRAVLERIRSFWSSLPTMARWSIRDAEQSPVRVGMGFLASAGCMMLLMAGFGMPESLEREVDRSFSEQYRYAHKISVDGSVDGAELDALEGLAGDGQWIMQAPVRLGGAQEAAQVLTVLACDGEVEQLVVPVSGGGAGPCQQGAVLSEAAASRLGLQIGDTIVVDAPGGGAPVALSVDGLTSASEPQGLFVAEEEWVAAGGEFTPTHFLASEADADLAVSGSTAVVSVSALSAQRSNAETLIAGLGDVFAVIKTFAVILAITVLLNLAALTFAERRRDYATLRTLGMHVGEIRAMVAVENLVTSMTGWLVGIPLGWWFLNTYVRLFSTESAQYHAWISWPSLVLASAITLACALSMTALIQRRLRRLDLVSELKGAE